MNQNSEHIWAEPLPNDCPPPDAAPPNYEAYYRLVDTVPPTFSDFQSIRAMFPGRKVPDECISRAISVFGTEDRCNKAKGLPLLKSKIIYKLELPPECGVMKRTGQDHYSWWRFGRFDIVGYCQELAR